MTYTYSYEQLFLINPSNVQFQQQQNPNNNSAKVKKKNNNGIAKVLVFYSLKNKTKDVFFRLYCVINLVLV